MSEEPKPAIQPGKPTKYWRKNWTPRKFALFLMAEDMKYVLPSMSNEQIMEDFKGRLHCGIGKVTWLRNQREFQATVEEQFIERIKSNFSTEMMFWVYLKHSLEKNLQSEKPSERLMDVLGYLSGKYNPRTSKPKKKDKLTPEQVAKYIHQREQINAKLNEKGKLDAGGKKKDG